MKNNKHKLILIKEIAELINAIRNDTKKMKELKKWLKDKER